MASSNNAVALLLLLPRLLLLLLLLGGGVPEAAGSELSAAAAPLACAGRRMLMADERLGSRPPQCAERCGRCTPCRPAYVAVPPAADVAEYYPEAWRCKCHGRLYVP